MYSPYSEINEHLWNQPSDQLIWHKICLLMHWQHLWHLNKHKYYSITHHILHFHHKRHWPLKWITHLEADSRVVRQLFYSGSNKPKILLQLGYMHCFHIYPQGRTRTACGECEWRQFDNLWQGTTALPVCFTLITKTIPRFQRTLLLKK